LPKPLYYLKPGDIIATASDCLKPVPPAAYRLLTDTGIQTILGPIQIVEILQSGTCALAGPNRRTDLERVLSLLAGYHVDVTLVDGALNRIVPMICADGIVISTGASYNSEIPATAQHIGSIAGLFTHAQIPGGEKHKHIHLRLADGENIAVHTTSLITPETLGKIRAYTGRGIERLSIPGACYPQLLAELLNSHPERAPFRELVLGNPLFLIASADPLAWRETLQKFEAGGVKIGYIETLPLLFITVSPFYPRFIQSTHSYEPAYVDAQAILKQIRREIPAVTVIDIQKTTEQKLQTLVY